MNRTTSIEALETRIAPAFAAVINLGALNGTNGFKLTGDGFFDASGRSVSGVGDFNNDGFDDMIIEALGEGYVVFGKAGEMRTTFALSTLDGSNGFKLVGEAALDFSSFSVSGAGDVNGDGFDDLIVGAGRAGTNDNNIGASYVVFGKAGRVAPILNLSTLNGSNGFKLTGEADGDKFGQSVSGAGDVNGDGFDDLIIGAPGTSQNGSNSGASYVVFGKAGAFPATLALSTLDGTSGLKLVGAAANDDLGSSVDAAGDVNGDGFDDIVIGAPGASGSSGATYVVFGKAGVFTAILSLSTLNGANGFKLIGDDFDHAGKSVSSAGDMNGDGFDDVIISGGTFDSYVVFGKAGGFGTTLSLSNLNGTSGFKLEPGLDRYFFGEDVRSAGDVNGDGFGDIITWDDRLSGSGSSACYVVFGKAGGFDETISLSSLNGRNGFKLVGEVIPRHLHTSLNSAGDVNGDGFDDIIIGESGASPNGWESGTSYVIFGKSSILSNDRKSATFLDTDGDVVTVKISKGTLAQQDFTFKSGVFQKLDLSRDPQLFAGTNIAVTVKKVREGDGRVNLGYLNATGVDLGAVSIAGDLGQVDAGDSNPATAAIKSLSVGSLGALGIATQDAAAPSLQSDLLGALAKLTVKGSVRGAVNVTGANLGPVSIGGDLDGSAGGALAGALRADGNIGKVTVKGSIIGGADTSGIIAGGKLGKVSIGGALASADATKSVTISALGDLSATTAAKAVAIAGLSVKTNVLNARILGGFTTSLVATNPDAGIGKITVGGNWAASSIAAGVADSTANGFGQNDTLFPGDTKSTIFASIASVLIKGTATGSPSGGDHFGITAQRVLNLKTGTTIHLLTGTANGILLDAANNDFRVVDFT